MTMMTATTAEGRPAPMTTTGKATPSSSAQQAASATHQSQAFASRFLAAVQVLDNQLATLLAPSSSSSAAKPVAAPLDQAAVADRLADLATAHRTLVSLEHQVTDAITTHFLPAYDQYKYLTRLRQLGARIESARASLRAGQKFRFKARHLLVAAPTAAELQRAQQEGREPEAKPVVVQDLSVQGNNAKPFADDPSVIRLDHLVSGQARVLRVAVPGADLHIANVGQGAFAIASVLLPTLSLDATQSSSPATTSDGSATIAPPRALHLHNIAPQSVILIHCPIDGSVLLESIQDAVVMIAACRQLRVHHAKNVLLCVHVVSDPIIEDSSGVVMVPYPTSNQLALWQHPNRFNQVKDFHWLVDSKPSPNWSVASPAWTEEVQGVVSKVTEWVSFGFSAVPAELAAEVKKLCPVAVES